MANANVCSLIIFSTVLLFYFNRVNGMECGSVNVTRELVLGGNRTLRTEWPFIAALYEATPTKYICGGTLISVRHVLTAAHCINRRHSSVKLSPGDIKVRLGAYNLTTEDEVGAVQRNVSAIYVNPDWKPYGDKYDADIAILVLSHNVTFSIFIQPICVPADDDVIDGAIINVTGTVVGWGLAEDKVFEEIPRKTVARAMNNSLCFRSEPSLIQYTSLRSFCAKGEDGTPNKGDSGGGFFVSGSSWMQFGIVSAINTNATGHAVANSFAIYTNVKSFKQWIVEKVTQSGGEVGELTMKVTLACTYGYGSLNRKGYGYTCLLNDLEIRTERNKIASVSGLHDFEKQNDDVDSIIFNNGAMFTLPDGLGNFFKNLRLLQIGNPNFTTLGLQHIWRSSLKNLERLEVLIVFRSDIEILQEDCLWDLGNLRSISLLNNRLKAIHEKTFEKNEKLKRVFLTKNSLETLPKNLFRNNILLEDIHLNENSIKTLDEDIFKFNTNVSFIDLSYNQLEVLPRNLVKQNLVLEFLYLNKNSLLTIDEQIFETNGKLKTINLSSNQLKFLPKNLFRNNFLLEYLYLADNSLTTINELTFEKNEKLTTIDLSSNHLEYLPTNLFKNNSFLSTLMLRNISLATIDEQLFETNAQLTFIDLSSNQLEFLPIKLLQNNLFLERLLLRSNYIKTIDEQIFEKNEELTFVDLSSNQLEFLPIKLFQNNLFLEILNFHNNSLRTVHEQTFEMNPELIKVNISNNLLTSIDQKLFKTNLNLKIVVLSSNKLESLPKNLFKNNIRLVLVGLDDNLLEIIDEQLFETNVELEAVSLERNKLESLPRNLFKNNKRLVFISLGFNLLKIIDEDIFETNVKVRRLFLAENQLEYLPRNLFKNNLLLEQIIFSGNNLVVIETDFTKLNFVNYIGLSNNTCVNAMYTYRNSYNISSDNHFENLTEFQNLLGTNCSLNPISL